MGSLWVSSERECCVPSLDPKETSQARVLSSLGRVGFSEIALTYAQGSQGTSSRGGDDGRAVPVRGALMHCAEGSSHTAGGTVHEASGHGLQQVND